MQVLDSLIDGPLRLRNRREGDELIGMIVRYLRTGEQPEPRTDAQEAVLFAVQPVMETSRKRIVAGGSGGKAASKPESKRASETGSKPPSKSGSKTQSKAASNDASKPESKRASETGSKPPSKSGSKTQSKAASNDASKPESKRASEEEEEEEEESGKGIKERGKAARFRAPSPAEVDEYARSYAEGKGLDLASTDFDPERFVDFYAQKGWMVGKAKMKDWKASVRIWVRSSKPKNGMAKEVPDDGFSAYD